MNVDAVLTALIASAILTSMPLMLAAVGESISEQSGLLNLGIEGSMLMTAFAAFGVALRTDSAPFGLLSGLLIGSAIGVVFGLLATSGRADQVVLGLGLTLAGTGGSAFLFREIYGSDQPLLSHGLGRPFDGWLDWIPVVGPAFADQRWFVYLAWILAALAHGLLTRTRLGCRSGLRVSRHLASNPLEAMSPGFG